jgi:predicted ATPase/DNA-binding NarL/FixJ family response regulator
MTPHPPPGNLPAEPNSFIGRERDLAELAEILGRVRALTLCGPGGIGKTRLAHRLAAMLAPGYRDGVWVADLADVDQAGDDRRLVPLVTAALGIRQEPDRQLADTLAEALRPRDTLLILDTCEHLAQPAAELVQRLLARCPGLRVIATSRQPLGVRGEFLWRVPPLGLPQASQVGGLAAEEVAQCEAVRLFVDRAAAVRPGFQLDEANVAAVAGICRTLDGVPLAIELAAARVRALSPEQIGARLADRFELLALGNRTAPPRHQTLRATVEWSYELLTQPERQLLSTLSVFGGWDLEMAEFVCQEGRISSGEVLELLRALIDKSLVSVDGELNGDARYRLLDTVRELAAEQANAAGALPGLRAAHRDCMLDIAERIASVAFVRGEPPWAERVAMYHRVRADRANFSAALGCCVQRGDAEAGLRLCHALGGSWLASGEVREGAGWLDRLLAIDGDAGPGGRPPGAPRGAGQGGRPPGAPRGAGQGGRPTGAPRVPPGVRARALALRAELAFELLDFAGAAGHALACLELSRTCQDGNPAGAYRLLALTSLVSGRTEQALEHADAAVAAARQMADGWEEGVALAARAAVIARRGDLDGAETAFLAALDVLRDNNGWGVANVLYGLGRVARARRDLPAADRYLRDALALYAQIDARPEMARCLAAIGWVGLDGNDLAVAASSLIESMQLSLATGHRLAIARGLQALATLASASGDLANAVRLAGAARAVFEVIGALPSDAAAGRSGRLLDAARAALGADAVASLLAEGQALKPQQAAHLVSAGHAQSPGSSRPAASARGLAVPLTEREVEVAGLVSRGLSNREIGEKLFISQATAARHVANIFAKIGVTSRAQLSAWMAENWQPADD